MKAVNNPEYEKRVIGDAVRSILFEPNDLITWKRFKNDIEVHKGFKVKCDKTLNTDEVIDKGNFKAIITLPSKKKVNLVLSITTKVVI